MITQNNHCEVIQNKNMNLFWIGLSVLIVLFTLLPDIHAETITQNFEGGMDIEIIYPDEIVVGRQGTISILVQNNGWEDKQDISFIFSSQDITLTKELSDTIKIDKLTQGGSYGVNVKFFIPSDIHPGVHFLNLKYSQVLVSNNEIPRPAIFHDIAIPITVKENANVIINTKTPESIFTNAEFPIEIEVKSEDITISNVSIKIIPPKNIEFRGETVHNFSKIEKNIPVEITSQIISPTEEINSEYKLPFEIIVEYTDDVGADNVESQTVSVILRPRTFMELTTEGGIWIGNFFIAPYISLGTIIGIPAGAIISLLIRRSQNVKKSNSKKKKKV